MRICGDFTLYMAMSKAMIHRGTCPQITEISFYYLKVSENCYKSPSLVSVCPFFVRPGICPMYGDKGRSFTRIKARKDILSGDLWEVEELRGFVSPVRDPSLLMYCQDICLNAKFL